MTTLTIDSQEAPEQVATLLHETVDVLAQAWRDYADALVADLEGDAEPTAAARCRDVTQAQAHRIFAKVRGAGSRMHPERIAVTDVVGLPEPQMRAIGDAGITNMAELLDRLAAGTLEELPGIGPGMVRKVEWYVEMARKSGWLA